MPRVRPSLAVAAQLLCALLLSPTASALNMNDEASKGFGRSYGFVYGQRLSLEYIDRVFPELHQQVQLAGLNFSAKFHRLEERLEKAMASIGKPAALRSKLDPMLAKQIEGITRQQATDFLELVNDRAAGKIPSPELEFILAAQYEETPAREFVNGFRQSYSATGHPKAKGLRLDMQMPKSWKGEEGYRPNIVRKWTSANGTGMETILLLVKTIGGERVTKADVAESLRNGEVKAMIPEGGTFIAAKAVTVEGQPAFVVEYDSAQDRAGIDLAMRAEMYGIFYGDYFISLQCMAGATKGDARKAASGYTGVKPLCQQVANSIVLPSRY
ncbi:hypothetical protein WDL1P1_00428 (plasmid) [Variovorax sp. WDL1]|nr:hypothetical protein WDL1P1_00428 [Variovorax sp. WDL1]